ncbi:MAG: DUF1989 domain-containing protein [Ktedonobacterales bacterium]
MQPFVEVPAREARAVAVPEGISFKVVDVEGGQVVDLFAFSADDVREYQSAEHTRVHVKRLFPRVGEQFVTNRRRPILTFEEDTTDGTHDMLCASCDPARYAMLGVEGWHASCQENLTNVMAELGHRDVDIPQPINLFMDIPVYEDGSIDWRAGKSKAGDFVRFRAEMDCIIVASACPQDLTDINNSQPSRIGIEVC